MLLACALMAGCGTIFTGTTDDIKFTANIPNVRLTIDHQPKGVIPITVKQSRGFMNGESFTAKFEADGYETQEFQLKRNFNTVAVLDITSIPTLLLLDRGREIERIVGIQTNAEIARRIARVLHARSREAS